VAPNSSLTGIVLGIDTEGDTEAKRKDARLILSVPLANSEKATKISSAIFPLIHLIASKINVL